MRAAIAPLFAIAALAFTTSPVEAGTDTAQLTVTATVQSGCSVSGGTLDFGTYIAGQVDDLDGVTQITLTNCAGTVTIELDGGQYGSVADRKMANGSARLQYQLYRDPSRTQIWGQGNNAYQGQILVDNAVLEVFGRIPGGQNVTPGTYTDIVNITVTF